MSARTTSVRGPRRRRSITLLWIAALFSAVIMLIYWEQTALLYILATVGVTALLVVVALADLAATETMSVEVSKLSGESGVRTESRR